MKKTELETKAEVKNLIGIANPARLLTWVSIAVSRFYDFAINIDFAILNSSKESPARGEILITMGKARGKNNYY